MVAFAVEAVLAVVGLCDGSSSQWRQVESLHWWQLSQWWQLLQRRQPLQWRYGDVSFCSGGSPCIGGVLRRQLLALPAALAVV